MFVCGLGQYEASLNGETIGDSFLAPGWTRYEKTCLYNTFDVTNMLHGGPNALGVIVGNGFYNINRERYRKLVIAYGMPKAICKLSLDYADGTHEAIVSSPEWKTAPSPVTFTSIYGGEDYDARLEQPGWNKAGFDDSNWRPALEVRAPGGDLTAEIDFPLKAEERIEVKSIRTIGGGSTLYDFGQNASGVFELKVSGQKGQAVTLTPGELINDDGRVNQNASGHPHQYTYILKGEGIETWRPRFTYYGFRYIQADGASPAGGDVSAETPRIHELTMLHTRNSEPATGRFECSTPLFNRIDSLIQWAIKSNLQSVVTDCPHREKLGWLEQTHLMGSAIHYNFNIHLLYKQLIQDMIDSQTEDGLVPDIAPEYVFFDGGFRDSPEWGAAAVILPWMVYQWYGDADEIEHAWPMMTRYMDYLGNKADDHILSHGLGDWYDLGPNFPGEAQLTPKALTATATYYQDADLMSRMADVSGRGAEAKQYRALADTIRKRFNETFYNSETHVYSTGSQTAMAMPLCNGMVDERDRGTVMKKLVESIHESGNALTAGDVGFHYLVQALQDGGASQLLYDMTARDDAPGYGFQLKKGATALTESWAALREVSNNHLMLGHLMDWLYRGLAGIDQAEDSIAYNRIVIAPNLVSGIEWVNASFESPKGTIESNWKQENGRLRLHVRIPANTSAEVRVANAEPGQSSESGKPLSGRDDIKTTENEDGQYRIVIGSGTYDFDLALTAH